MASHSKWVGFLVFIYQNLPKQHSYAFRFSKGLLVSAIRKDTVNIKSEINTFDPVPLLDISDQLSFKLMMDTYHKTLLHNEDDFDDRLPFTDDLEESDIS